MAQDSKYFRLGLFVLVGLLLMAGLAIIFGLGRLFTETVPAETYFNESVEGLERGSAVKYRGVDIGSVSEIGFLAETYPSAEGEAERYVLVRMDLRREVVESLAQKSGIDLRERVARGLRIRLTTMGLTGVTFLEIDYLDPERNPLLPIDWTPEMAYIPSAPSTYSRLEGILGNISTTLDTISKIDFSGLVNSANAVIATLDETLKDADVESLGKLLAKTLAELRATASQARKLLASPEVSTAVNDASRTMASLRRMSEGAEEDVLSLARSLRQTSASFARTAEALHEVLADPGLKRGLAQLPGIMDNIRAASGDFGRAAQQLNMLAGSASDLTLSQRQSIEAMLSSLNTLLNNLNALAEDLRQNPSRALLGQPPREVSPNPFGNR